MIFPSLPPNCSINCELAITGTIPSSEPWASPRYSRGPEVVHRRRATPFSSVPSGFDAGLRLSPRDSRVGVMILQFVTESNVSTVISSVPV